MELLAWLAVLAYPVLAVLALVTVVRSSNPKNKGRRLRIAAATFGVPFLFFFLDEIVGQAHLHALCILDGGYTVSETVRADGYFSPHRDRDRTLDGCALDCQNALLVNKFRYFETDVRYDFPYFTDKKGVHQFFLVDRQSGKCSREGKQTKWKQIPPTMCIAYTISDNPTSKYEIVMEGRDPTQFVGFVPYRLQRNYSYVKDRISGVIVGSETTFRFWGGWVRDLASGHTGSATVCPANDVSHRTIFKKIILTTEVSQ
jgi:hypothetical protein